jgi:competence protein ComEC
LPTLTISIITIAVGLVFVYIRGDVHEEILEDSIGYDLVGEFVHINGRILPNYAVKSTSITADVYCLQIMKNDKWTDCDGIIRTTLRKYPSIHTGEIVGIKGKIMEPVDLEGDFSYSEYLKKKKIYYVMYYPEILSTGEYDINHFLRALYSIRDRTVEKMNRYLPEPHSSLLSGVLLGVKNAMPEGFSDDLRRTGTTHIIAASGYNVAIISSILLSSMKFLSRRLRIVVGIVFVWIFVIISGASIPVVRAAIMITISLIALLLGRYSNPVQSLVLSAAIMFLMDSFIFEDISFQLSFLSTAGLIFIVPIGKKYLSFIPKYLEESVIVTISAILSTFPITTMNFHSFSIISPISNLLVLPTVELIMLLGSVFLVIPEFLTPLLWVFSIVLWVPLDYFIKVVSYLSRLPFSSIEVHNFVLVSAIFCYFILGIVIILHPNIKHNE